MSEIGLHTVHYLEGNPAQGKLTPRMVGFLNEIEREFFEMFCSVDGVGVKKALRAMVRPVRDVAFDDRRAGCQRSVGVARNRTSHRRADYCQTSTKDVQVCPDRLPWRRGRWRTSNMTSSRKPINC